MAKPASWLHPDWAHPAQLHAFDTIAEQFIAWRPVLTDAASRCSQLYALTLADGVPAATISLTSMWGGTFHSTTVRVVSASTTETIILVGGAVSYGTASAAMGHAESSWQLISGPQ